MRLNTKSLEEYQGDRKFKLSERERGLFSTWVLRVYSWRRGQGHCYPLLGLCLQLAKSTKPNLQIMNNRWICTMGIAANSTSCQVLTQMRHKYTHTSENSESWPTWWLGVKVDLETWALAKGHDNESWWFLLQLTPSPPDNLIYSLSPKENQLSRLHNSAHTTFSTWNVLCLDKSCPSFATHLNSSPVYGVLSQPKPSLSLLHFRNN